MAGLGGFLLGGLLGRMFFGGMGYGYGGGGIGLFGILLIVGGLFLLLRFLRGRTAPAYGGPSSYGREEADPYGVGGYEERPGRDYESSGSPYRGPDIPPRGGSRAASAARGEIQAEPGFEGGLRAIAASDPSFSREGFLRQARENFMRFQGAWVARDLSPIRELLDKDICAECERDLEALRREGRINRLDGIEVRRLDLVEAWQEEGHDFITVRYEASLLDYVVSEGTGEVLEGSRTDPVLFAELWTWARPAGPNPWFLSAIEQA